MNFCRKELSYQLANIKFGYLNLPIFVCLIECFTYMVNSCGHVGKVSYLTTLFLGKLLRGSLPELSAHSFTVTYQLALHESAEGGFIFSMKDDL